MMKKFIFFNLILLLVLPTFAGAVTGNNFNIKVGIDGTDTIPPSTPTLLSAIPIAPTQIDLAWTTATDDWLLGGYVVLRDSIPIATTTLTNYSDTGLTAETLYSYSVYAFDWSHNISTTSNSLATTTLAIPVVATSTPTQTTTSGTKVLALRDFRIETKENSATLSWETSRPSSYTLRWGRTDLYTGGYIENESFRTTQKTTITELEPGTVYMFELIGYTPSGLAITLKAGQFTTTKKQDNRVVPNVERLTATVDGVDVSLDYKLPASEPGARVRILRSHLGFPTDLNDGAITYEGDRNNVKVKEALLNHDTQYYTVFVIGADGTVSSGAVVMVTSREKDSSGEGSTPGGATTTEPEILLPLLSLDQIVIIQNDKRMTFFDDSINLSYQEPFIISIDRKALPEHLKSIIVTLLDPTDQRRSYSFLLRINKTGTAYEATVSALGVVGTSRLQVEVFDFNQLVVGRYRKQIDFIAITKPVETVIFPDVIFSSLSKVIPFFIALLGLFIIWWLFIFWRRRRTEDKQ